MKLQLILSIAVMSFCLVSPANAQDEFEQVKVLDHPRFSLTDRFNVDLDFTFLPLDAYYKPLLIEGAISYQPVDWFSWEIGRFGYSLTNINSGLESTINALATPRRVNDEDLKLKELQYHAASIGYINLLYSKSNFFNQSIVYYYWQLGSGVSYYRMKHGDQLGLDVAMRVRFFINNHISINLHGGDTVGFKDKSSGPKNIMFLGLGAGFAF
jgi:hypothetical protein